MSSIQVYHLARGRQKSQMALQVLVLQPYSSSISFPHGHARRPSQLGVQPDRNGLRTCSLAACALVEVRRNQ